MDKTDQLLYHERLSSNRTLALFAALTLTFGLLGGWRAAAVRLDGLAAALFFFSAFFLFYTFNYRILTIRLTPTALTLKFGLFRWRVTLDNIANCQLDPLSGFMRYGGAGIHFMMVDKRYRASFNFLEYPRVVLAFRRKVGPVRDISFSTRQPDKIIHQIKKVAP